MMHNVDLESMLPHRKPMLMISAVLESSDEQLIALSRIDANNPLLQDGCFPGYGCLELLAQASGLFLGLKMQGEAEPGAIVSVRDMHIKKCSLALDKDLYIETNFLGGSGSAAMFQGVVRQSDEIVMQASLTVSSFSQGDKR